MYIGQQLIIYGVPSAHSVMSPLKIFLAIVAVFVVWLGPQVLMVIGAIGRIGLLITAIIGVGGLAILITAIILSARRSGGGTSRLLFQPGSVQIIPIKVDPTKPSKEAFHAFLGTETINLQPVGPFWANLTIQTPGKPAVLKAGIRCPEPWRAPTIRALQDIVQAGAPPRGIDPSQAPPPVPTDPA